MCITEDTFIEDERRIMASNVRNIFTPHTPINNEDLFKGRTSEVQQILSTLNTPGQHLLLYGDRGVGKSSLAIIASHKIVNIANKKLKIKRCSKTDSFISIMEEALEACGVDLTLISKTKTSGISIKGFGLENSNSYEGYLNKANSPSWVCEKIKDENILLLIDEFDSIKSQEDKHKIAELIKLLSDSHSVFKIFIVGIAESAEELTVGHPSVQRCLKEIKLSKMLQREILEIINAGGDKLHINFTRDAKFRIFRLSSGYPHFTHLICLKASEEAIINEKAVIDIDDVNNAIEKSISDCENSLRQAYDDVFKSSSTIKTYRKILYAIALCWDEFIRAENIRLIYNLIFDESITNQKLNQYLSKIVSNSNDKILRRLAKGVYRFSDPRMSSYIRLVQSDMYSEKEEMIYKQIKSN
ncbi:nSTAND1 domain-containing NTPase [Phocaeicola paurosaccharolyticus]|uniref:nSTAND1 domain-containing NTPase n=1 Tax=Phocaeicola paurosaccharolyticus TaxID=732242 RepID=UPI00046A45C2|nr:ATP-binding protein [Phocaeicola paurosaccharolyticus]